MKWLGRPSPFHLFTNPCVINRFIFGQGVVIYYIARSYSVQLDNLLTQSLDQIVCCNCAKRLLEYKVTQTFVLRNYFYNQSPQKLSCQTVVLSKMTNVCMVPTPPFPTLFQSIVDNLSDVQEAFSKNTDSRNKLK